MSVHNQLNLLGKRVTDVVTGFSGIVTSICFDLYGCIQATIHPGIGEDGKMREQHWFDISRLRIESDEPVMNRPDFDWTPQIVADGGKGAAEKPTISKS